MAMLAIALLPYSVLLSSYIQRHTSLERAAFQLKVPLKKRVYFLFPLFPMLFITVLYGGLFLQDSPLEMRTVLFALCFLFLLIYGITLMTVRFTLKSMNKELKRRL